MTQRIVFKLWKLLIFYQSRLPRSLEICTDLTKVSFLFETTGFSLSHPKFCLYLWDIQSLKISSGVPRSGYKVDEIWKMFFYILLLFLLFWKNVFDIEKEYPSLSQVTLKYLAYYQVFPVHQRWLQDQWKSIWLYFVSLFAFQVSCNTKKTVKQCTGIS